MRLGLRQIVLVAAVACLLFPRTATAQESASTFGPLPVFEFHSGFWINLHHTLYFEAKQRAASTPAANKPSTGEGLTGKTMRDAASLSASERAAWDAAVSYYVANYATKDLLFNNDLALLKNQLEDFEDCDELSGTRKKRCDAGLPPKLTQVLESASAVYRAHLWADHDRANRRWVTRVAPLVEEQGVGISERLADVYQTKWPKAKIRVDVSAYANWAGAYTTLDPLRVTISSADSRNQGDEALEVLFHEASHGIAEVVQSAITRECRQRGKAIPRDLWHALIFYTTGEVIRPLLAEEPNSGPGKAPLGGPGTHAGSGKQAYTPYAMREGLYQRGWSDYFRLLTQFWQPYLESKATFDDAIARMVSAL